MNFEQAGTHIMEELKRMSNEIRDLDSKLDALAFKIARREGRDGVIAALMGGGAGLVVAAVALWKL